MCLANSEVMVRGRITRPDDTLDLSPGARPILLYPAEDAVLLDALPRSPPATLIVPDGNWRQASKVRSRIPGMRDVPCARLPPGEPSIYRLRSEAHPHGLATIEAIARAIAILESEDVARALERAFRAMVERTLWARGAIEAEDVTGGIPAGASRHDPESGVGYPPR
jgi:DTW domain-containing protein YfiP